MVFLLLNWEHGGIQKLWALERYWTQGARLKFTVQLVGCGSPSVDSTEQGTDSCGMLVYMHTCLPYVTSRNLEDPGGHKTRAEIQSKGQ